MHVTHIEREVGSLPLDKELIRSRHTKEQALSGPPQPVAPEVQAAELAADADALAGAHSLDEARVAALLADPLA